MCPSLAGLLVCAFGPQWNGDYAGVFLQIAIPSTQNDYSVITTFQIEDGVYYLLDVTRGRFDYPLLRATVIELAKRFKPTWVLIEDASTGVALTQELKPMLHRLVELAKVEHNKVIRLYVQQQKFAAGLVRFPKGAAFMPELERELLTFPQSKHTTRSTASAKRSITISTTTPPP